ncbi:ADP-heptose:LPS heptosyltransferase [Pseudomonas sp. NFACC19-2]|uniref:glycosyltransferase family 9 protein n=1 Tax=Ectopseudomonas toyotomiensis TaxID=554344 RepID=UPI00090895F8|nr:glycosyltransferase family 9 protein [Pseudomonas sp. NFACC19-2]SFW22441.1 ADP-heptose:LPS heptosyltransferase [Pseudomonas sp. NFACC19-2]
MSGEKTFIRAGMKVAVVSCSALGDTTLFLRLAWRLQAAGAQVTVVSASLSAVREYLPGLEIIGETQPDVAALAESNDLVICYIDWLIKASQAGVELLSLSNVAYLSGKKLPARFQLDQRSVLIDGVLIPAAHNVICRDPKAGKTMVQWIDLYAEEVLGLDPAIPLMGFQFLPAAAGDAGFRIAIFPTTPHAKKNYSSRGYRRLARSLVAKGWQVEFVGTPAERDVLQAQYEGFTVHAFTDLKGLVDFLCSCSIVISNDSGGGHLGSLLGLRTFTITRRRLDFTWRPGFNSLNRVINPLFTFKWMGKTVWRPFIPLSRVLREIPTVMRR